MENKRSLIKYRTKDVQGVECSVCGGETFRLFERETEMIPGMPVKIKCCSACVKRIDAYRETSEEEKNNKKDLEGLTKSERRKKLQEISRGWARNLDGKKVIIFWDASTHPVFCGSHSQYYARGTAYLMKDTCGGWGQVKVILDSEENKRVSLACHETGYCSKVKMDMYFASMTFLCDDAECKEQIPVIDGKKHRWNRIVYPTGDGNWCIPVTWGERKTIKVLE